MSNDVLIQVEGVRKKFCRSLKRSLLYGARDVLAESFASGSRTHQELRRDEFWALSETSFQLRRGECLGLLGHNGAGKTTLLKILNGIIKPDSGRVTMRGHVGAIIALGAGFNPILSGRENVYVKGAMLGFTKREVDRQMDGIVDFAEIGEFIDSPVQSYSSGMQVRLGFAVATAMRPDVLLLDEVLAVGDAAFRFKCYNRLAELIDQAAVIFVSHNLEEVARICTRCLVLDHGKTVPASSKEDAIQKYSELSSKQKTAGESFERLAEPITGCELDWSGSSLDYGDPLTVRVRVTSDAAMNDCSVRLMFHDQSQALAGEWSSLHHGVTFQIERGIGRFEIRVNNVHLKPGTYRASFLLYDSGNFRSIAWHHRVHKMEMKHNYAAAALYQMK